MRLFYLVPFLPVQIREFSLKPAKSLKGKGGEPGGFYLSNRENRDYIPAGSPWTLFLFAKVLCFISFSGGQTLEKSSQGDRGYGSARAEVLMPGERGRERS